MALKIVTKDTPTVAWEYNTIGEAVTAATSGDEILIKPGEWEETVNVVGKSLKFQGEDVDSVVWKSPVGATYLLQTNSTLDFGNMSLFNNVASLQGIVVNGATADVKISNVKATACHNTIRIQKAASVEINLLYSTQHSCAIYLDSQNTSGQINGTVTALGSTGIYIGYGEYTLKNNYITTASGYDLWVTGSASVANVDETNTINKVRVASSGALNATTLYTRTILTESSGAINADFIEMTGHGTITSATPLSIIKIPNGITMTLGANLTVSDYINKLGSITYAGFTITGPVVVYVDSSIVGPGVTDYYFNPNNSEATAISIVIIDEGINCHLQSDLYVNKCVLIYGQLSYEGYNVYPPSVVIKPATSISATWGEYKANSICSLVIGGEVAVGEYVAGEPLMNGTVEILMASVLSTGIVSLIKIEIFVVDGVWDMDGSSVYLLSSIDVPEFESSITNNLSVIKYVSTVSSVATIKVLLNGEDVLEYTNANVYNHCNNNIFNGLMSAGDSVSFSEYYNFSYGGASDEYVNWFKCLLRNISRGTELSGGIVNVHGKYGGVAQIGSMSNKKLALNMTMLDDIWAPKRSDGHIAARPGGPFAKNLRQTLNTITHEHGEFVLLNPIEKMSFMITDLSDPEYSAKSGGTMANFTINGFVCYFEGIGRR